MEVLLRRVVNWTGRAEGGDVYVSLCTSVCCCTEREREENWRELIDATRSRCSALLGYQKQSAGERLSSSLSFSQGAVERIERHALIFHSHTRVPVTCLESDSQCNMGFFPPSHCSVCFSVRAVFAAAPGALVRDVCLCLHHAETSAPSQRCERSQQQPLSA